MLNFKNVTSATVIFIIVVVVTNYFSHVPAWFYLVIILSYILVLIWGSYFIQSGFYIKAICNGNKQNNQVALTFDDGPSNENTIKILDILKQNQIEAAFFCIGEHVKKYPDSVKRMNNENHLIGNHSESHHFFFDFFPEYRVIKEINSTNQLIQNIIGLTPKYFRPPYGVTTPILSKAIKKSGMTTIGWSLRTYDTITKNENKLVDKISDRIKAGDIILLHDHTEVTINALPEIIKIIKQKGMEIVRLDKLIKEPSYV